MTQVSSEKAKNERYERAVLESIKCDKGSCPRKDCDGFLCRNAVEAK